QRMGLLEPHGRGDGAGRPNEVSRRRILVHSLREAEAVLAAAVCVGVPVMLASAAHAGCYVGPRWFLALFAAASATHPAADAECLIDCADEPGTAFAALRAGAKRVRFTGRAELRAKLAEIAEAYGAALEHEEAPALDLLDAADPMGAALDYLKTS
ncbi:MAG: hypothetical protein ACREFQ_10100, partial [Stellaceae bacterium]